MSLPPPSPNQAFVQISALEAGSVNIPLAWLLDGVKDEDRTVVPVLGFLIRHPSKSDNLVFDLGLRADWENLPPFLVGYIREHMGFRITVSQDIVGALAKGGLKPTDVTHVCYSHLHFDHIGDSAPFTKATFLVGEGARPLLADAYPANPNGVLASDLLPEGRTTFLDPSAWPALGPFPHALDYYGDGSVYIIDAGAGHLPGHLNVLARTSADGGWIYLGGDSAHHWSIITGEGKIGKHAHFGCAHIDVAATEEHLDHIRTLMKENPRAKVILAHDTPWYEENKGKDVFWPGVIPSP